MGVAVKYLATVKGRFWKKAGLAPDALTDGMVSMTWDGTDNQGSDANGAALVAFSGGPAAERCRQRWATRQRRRLHRSAFADLSDVSRRTSCAAVSWIGPATCGRGAGYSFPAPGQITKAGPLLRAGVGRLHFAGEHTSYKFVGYMEGALNSGVTVAKRIAMRDAGATTPSARAGGRRRALFLISARRRVQRPDDRHERRSRSRR